MRCRCARGRSARGSLRIVDRGPGVPPAEKQRIFEPFYRAPSQVQNIELDGLHVDLNARVVRRDGEEIHLMPIEFDLLRTLVRHRGRLMTHRALLVEVWGPQYAEDTQVLRAHIANLRRKIEPTGERRYIRTDPGIGYRFAA